MILRNLLLPLIGRPESKGRIFLRKFGTCLPKHVPSCSKRLMWISPWFSEKRDHKIGFEEQLLLHQQLSASTEYLTDTKCSDSFSALSVLRQVYSLFQSEFFRECETLQSLSRFIISNYENKTSKFVLRYYNLLHHRRRKPPTCFGHLLWPSSERCIWKDILERT